MIIIHDQIIIMIGDYEDNYTEAKAWLIENATHRISIIKTDDNGEYIYAVISPMMEKIFCDKFNYPYGPPIKI